MLPVWLATTLIAVGVACVLVGAILGLRARGARPPVRANALFYGGALIAIVGLQPIRPFRVEFAEPYLLPPNAAARDVLLAHLRDERWVIGAARPVDLVASADPLQPEIATRFERFVARDSRLGEADGLPFVFVGRRTDGWSRNPNTALATFGLVAAVLVLSSVRRILRTGLRRQSAS
jgi:hypothetical protein